MPLRHPRRHDPGNQARKQEDGGSSTMNKIRVSAGMDRRAFLAASGALVITATASGSFSDRACADVSETRPAFTPDQLDSWLSLDKAGNVTAYFGKIDVAQGIDVSVSQIIA